MQAGAYGDGVGEGLHPKLVLGESGVSARYSWVSPVIMFPFYKSQREALAWPRESQRGKAPFPALGGLPPNLLPDL